MTARHLTDRERDREWGWDWRGPQHWLVYWSTPYIAVRFGRCWRVSLAFGPWHLHFGYTEIF